MRDGFAPTDALLACRGRRGRPWTPRWPGAGSGSSAVAAGSGSTNWRVRSGGAANACGPGSRRRPVSRPKRAAKLVRFDHAVHRLAAGEDAVRIAADSGYVDQSHLHRDVLEFTRMTPATAAREPGLAVDDIA